MATTPIDRNAMLLAAREWERGGNSPSMERGLLLELIGLCELVWTSALPSTGGPEKGGSRPTVHRSDGAVDQARRYRVDPGIANKIANEIAISRVLYRGLDGIRVGGSHRDTPVEENRAGQVSQLEEN